jgi:hypothetical protein
MRQAATQRGESTNWIRPASAILGKIVAVRKSALPNTRRLPEFPIQGGVSADPLCDRLRDLFRSSSGDGTHSFRTGRPTLSSPRRRFRTPSTNRSANAPSRDVRLRLVLCRADLHSRSPNGVHFQQSRQPYMENRMSTCLMNLDESGRQRGPAAAGDDGCRSPELRPVRPSQDADAAAKIGGRLQHGRLFDAAHILCLFFIPTDHQTRSSLCRLIRHRLDRSRDSLQLPAGGFARRLADRGCQECRSYGDHRGRVGRAPEELGSGPLSLGRQAGSLHARFNNRAQARPTG